MPGPEHLAAGGELVEHRRRVVDDPAAEPRLAANPVLVKGLHAMVHDVVERLGRYNSRAVSLSFDAYNVDIGGPE